MVEFHCEPFNQAPQLRRSPLGGHMAAGPRRTTLLCLGAALLLCTLATSCWRLSRVSLLPTPSASPAAVRSSAIFIVDSIVRAYKLEPYPGEGGCEIESSSRGSKSPDRGALAGSWRSGSLDVNVCTDPSHPEFFRIDVRDFGFAFRDNARSLRESLSAALRSRFGPETVVVEPK